MARRGHPPKTVDDALDFVNKRAEAKGDDTLKIARGTSNLQTAHDNDVSYREKMGLRTDFERTFFSEYSVAYPSVETFRWREQMQAYGNPGTFIRDAAIDAEVTRIVNAYSKELEVMLKAFKEIRSYQSETTLDMLRRVYNNAPVGEGPEAVQSVVDLILKNKFTQKKLKEIYSDATRAIVDFRSTYGRDETGTEAAEKWFGPKTKIMDGKDAVANTLRDSKQKVADQNRRFGDPLWTGNQLEDEVRDNAKVGDILRPVFYALGAKLKQNTQNLSRLMITSSRAREMGTDVATAVQEEFAKILSEV